MSEHKHSKKSYTNALIIESTTQCILAEEKYNTCEHLCEL